MRARRLLLTVAALFLAACTTTTPDRSPTQSTVVQSSKAPHKDRDERAVLAALQRIDVCALVKAATTAEPKFVNDPSLTAGPSSCEHLVRDGADTASATIEYGILDTDQKRASTSVVLGGAKAYQLRGLGDFKCDIALPVSFRHAIFVSVGDVRQKSQPCVVGKPVAAAAATALADPSAARTEPSWNPCTVQNELPDEYITQAGKQFCMENGVVRLAYDTMPETSQVWQPNAALHDGYQSGTVGDIPVVVEERSDKECFFWWRAGPAPSPYAAEGDLLAIARQPDCARAQEVVALIAPVLATAPPTDVAPQHPLLYKPDEKDTP